MNINMHIINDDFKKELSAAINQSVLPILKKLDYDLTVAIDYVPDVSLSIRVSTVPGVYNKEDWKEL